MGNLSLLRAMLPQKVLDREGIGVDLVVGSG
jgi:hypothetical protein